MKKRKNPQSLLRVIENKASYFYEIPEYELGNEAYIYIFELKEPLLLNNKFIYPGKYIFKHLKYDLRPHEQDKLILYSKYGLIPEIFLITKNFIIMNYIKGINLDDYLYQLKSIDLKKLDEIEDAYFEWEYKIRNIIKSIENLPLCTRDISTRNTLIKFFPNGKYKFYMIDPWVRDEMFFSDLRSRNPLSKKLKTAIIFWILPPPGPL